MTHWTDALAALSPCSDALKWARTQPDADTAWRTCERGDWMLWLVGKLDKSEPYSEERKPLVRVACECARLGWNRMPQASRNALIVVEQWTRGGANAEALEAAAWASWDAAWAAAWDARDAARAAEAAGAVVGDARAAALAAWAAGTATHAHCAHIVRKHYPAAPQIDR